MGNAKFLGNTDDVTTCECCGKQNLKSTVALELEDGGEPVYFGVTCAARALAMSAKDVRVAARTADRARATAEAAARNAAFAAEDAAWQDFLNAAAPEFSRSFMGGPDRFRQLDKLGGYTAARSAFLAAFKAAA